jgi:4-amino-4-deoxy-L-arabinose transferase-like glycosyltransferase
MLLSVLSVVASLAYVWLWCPLDLSPDEAHYWDWSRHLDWSYYSKGPLVAWLIRASCELFGSLSISLTGDLAAAVRLPAALCHAAFLAGWYVLAAGCFRSPRLGLVVVASGIALPLMRAGAVIMTIDPPFMACWCWAIVCVWRAQERDSGGWWLGAGVCTAVGTLAKYTMALFPLAVLGFLVFHRRQEFRKPGVWLFLACAAGGWLPVVVWNLQHDWVSFRHVFWQVGEGKPGTTGLAGVVAFVGGQFGMMFGFWLVAFLAAAWRFRPLRTQESAITLLWWTSAPVWCIFAMMSLVSPGQPNWAISAYVGGFVLAIAWTGEQLSGRHPRMIRLGIVFSVLGGVAITVLAHFPDVIRPAIARVVSQPTEANPTPTRRFDLTARLLGWNSLATEVDRVRERVRTETGSEPIIAGMHWTLPGLLGLYCQDRPQVYSIGIPNQSDRHSQYDLWRPNPVDDAQEFRGRSFVIVGDIGSTVRNAFERIEQPLPVVLTRAGVPVAKWTIWVAHGFRGFTHETTQPANPRY